ncbi:hypothetical protein OG818_40620 [Streptomyces virginiae]|uniref:hypothetical protein n=1 Tax=Streptomyces virginiae TaxID=1961 RepID=UPI002256BEFD|nr:hypothetical protein [Streptomyces virginiae]MCX4721998.1 hypothetical protein [Streptomyces virginiae]
MLRMLDDEDSVIPSIKADPKDVRLVTRLIDELERVRDKNRGRRSVPGRPTLNRILLTATPTSKYASVLLPYVRYSADAKKLYDDECPLPILLPNSVPSVDYRKVMTHLGFLDRAA